MNISILIQTQKVVSFRSLILDIGNQKSKKKIALEQKSWFEPDQWFVVSISWLKLLLTIRNKLSIWCLRDAWFSLGVEVYCIISWCSVISNDDDKSGNYGLDYIIPSNVFAARLVFGSLDVNCLYVSSFVKILVQWFSINSSKPWWCMGQYNPEPNHPIIPSLSPAITSPTGSLEIMWLTMWIPMQ